MALTAASHLVCPRPPSGPRRFAALAPRGTARPHPKGAPSVRAPLPATRCPTCLLLQAHPVAITLIAVFASNMGATGQKCL